MKTNTSFSFSFCEKHYFAPYGQPRRCEFVSFVSLKKAKFTNGETLRLTPQGWLPKWLKIKNGKIERA